MQISKHSQEEPLQEPTIKDLLEALLNALQETTGNDLVFDTLLHRQIRVPATSTDPVNLEVQSPYEYVYIPSLACDMVIAFGYGAGNPIVYGKQGQPVLFRWPRLDSLTFIPTGIATDTVTDIYLSTRPIDVPSAIADTELGPATTYADNTTPPTAGFVNTLLYAKALGGSTMFSLRTYNNGAQPDGTSLNGDILLVNNVERIMTGAPGGTALFDKKRTPSVFIPIAPTAVVAGTGIVVWAPAAGRKFRLMGWSLSLTVAGEIIFCDNVVGSPFMRTGLLPASIAQQSPDLGNGFLSATAANALRLDVTAGGSIQGMVYGTLE